MKKFLFLMLLTVLTGMGTFAKTHTIDLIAPESITYTLDEHEDSLKCSLFIEENGLFGIKIRSVSTSSDFPEKIRVTLYDKGRELSSFTTKSSGFNEEKYYMFEGLTDGEYTLKIQNETRFGDVTFTADTFFTPWENVESQGERNFDGATPLISGERFMGGVMLTDTSDFYLFDMPKDGYAIIDMYSSEMKFFTLYNEEKEEIGTMEIKLDDPTKVFETRCGLKKGRYYITVTPEEDCLNPEYSLEIKALFDSEFEAEYNNTLSDATPLSVGKEVRGNLFGCEDTDFYTFELDKKSNAKITLNDMYLTKNGHYNFTILDSDGKVIAEEIKCGTKVFEIVLEKGQYYAKVSCPSGDYFTPFGYKISVKSTPVPSSEDENGEANGEDTEKPDTPSNNLTEQFEDVGSDKWYATEILTARQKGLVLGDDNNHFRPDDNVTVGEVITMASRLHQTIYNTEFSFDGTDGEKWYTPYVAYALTVGIIQNEDFSDYERKATRSETAYIFASVFGDEVTYDKEAVVPDVDKSAKYSDEIHMLYSLGILKGMNDNGDFLPDKNVTRAETTAVMLRCFNVSMG